MPIITGLFKTALHLCTVTELLDGAPCPGRRVIIIGGGQAGLLAADFLAHRGKIVWVLNRRAHFAEEMSSNDRYYLRERLNRDTVTLCKKVTALEFRSHGVRFESAGTPVVLDDCDTVVIAEGMVSVRQAAGLLGQYRGEVHLIGDARSPRNLMLSLAEAEELGRAL